MLEGVTRSPDSLSISALLERYNLFVVIYIDIQVMCVWRGKEERLAWNSVLYILKKELNDFYILFIIKVYSLFQSKMISSGSVIKNNSLVFNQVPIIQNHFFLVKGIKDYKSPSLQFLFPIIIINWKKRSNSSPIV